MSVILANDAARITNGQAIADLAALNLIRPDDETLDARTPPLAPNSFDTVAWDPPYGYRGTSTLASDARYGIGAYSTPDAIDGLLIDGMRSAIGLARRVVLVKCQDQNIASRFRDQSGFVTEAARNAGAKVVGKLYVAARREQPAGKRQLNVWGYHSVLLVLA